uniref:Uncharacterized protein n=1 Tax=Arundo donax TaxID=35708 RepID=A0A0A9EKI8_ARUDO
MRSSKRHKICLLVGREAREFRQRCLF